jgi:hypothetical protein
MTEIKDPLFCYKFVSECSKLHIFKDRDVDPCAILTHAESVGDEHVWNNVIWLNRLGILRITRWTLDRSQTFAIPKKVYLNHQ